MRNLLSTGASAVPLALLALLVVLEGAFAQITSNATCTADTRAFFNSKGQSPCLVAAYLGGQCNGGQYDVSGLGPSQHYIGPTAAIADECQCNTVMYSVMAACSTCQNASVITWSAWSQACTQVYRQIYPTNIPPNTAVPGWAYQDVIPSDTFDVTAALNSNAPESTASNNQVTQTGRPTSTGRPSPTGGSSSDGGGGSNTGAIVGGVVGGIVGLAVIALLVFFFLRRQRRNNASNQGTQLLNNGAGASPYMQSHGAPVTPGTTTTGYDHSPLMPSATGRTGGYEGVPYSPTPVSAYGPNTAGVGAGGRLYDPNDPATFPASPAPPTFHSQYTGGSGAPPHMPVPHQQQQPYAPPTGMYRGAPEV